MRRGPPDPDTPSPRLGRGLSHHILPNAATMAGLCSTLIGLVKLGEADAMTRQADEMLAYITVLFVVSALCSYGSIRATSGAGRSERLEWIADVTFIIALVALAVVSLLFAHEQL
ncbi:hypothetical protein [Methylobacterium oryzisoli]|uniref:hypothetical protein n=1 Tax=Methylobacterium oryzisoli TaxID=3385502 RepID=UPI003891FFBB